MLKSFVYTSAKHRRESELLDRFNEAVFVLKLDALGELDKNGYNADAVATQRQHLHDMLDTLIMRVEAAPLGASTGVQPAYTALARRFIEVNPADVADRVAALGALTRRLAESQPLTERDYGLLNRIQALLEGEISREIHSVFAF